MREGGDSWLVALAFGVCVLVGFLFFAFYSSVTTRLQSKHEHAIAQTNKPANSNSTFNPSPECICINI